MADETRAEPEFLSGRLVRGRFGPERPRPITSADGWPEPSKVIYSCTFARHRPTHTAAPGKDPMAFPHRAAQIICPSLEYAEDRFDDWKYTDAPASKTRPMTRGGLDHKFDTAAWLDDVRSRLGDAAVDGPDGEALADEGG